LKVCSDVVQRRMVVAVVVVVVMGGGNGACGSGAIALYTIATQHRSYISQISDSFESLIHS
uniref:Transmembrane protein n=1 Tax=Brugia timori TaxID=42155 RepID=A0A0R3QLW9_9BILA